MQNHEDYPHHANVRASFLSKVHPTACRPGQLAGCAKLARSEILLFELHNQPYADGHESVRDITPNRGT